MNPRPTIQAVLEQLNAFAAEQVPDQYVTSLSLIEHGGAVLTVHYTGSGPDEVPREACLLFTGTDRLSCALVYDPTMFMRAIEEGLDVEHAEAAARRVVGDVSDVEAYLAGKAYRLV